jgi:hypothetical protein
MNPPGPPHQPGSEFDRSPATELTQVAMFDRFLQNPVFQQALRISQSPIQILPTTHGFRAIARERNRYSSQYYSAMASNAFWKLCHINVNVVRNEGFYWTLCGGVWFRENIRQLIPPGSWPHLISQLDLFDAMVSIYEKSIANNELRKAFRFNWYNIDPNTFGRLVSLAERKTEDILFGNAMMSPSQYRDASPQRRELQNFISGYLWQEWFDEYPFD